MAGEIVIKGKKVPKGKRGETGWQVSHIRKGTKMMPGAGWRFVATAGVKPLLFVGTLLGTVNRGKSERIAIFSVPKG